MTSKALVGITMIQSNTENYCTTNSMRIKDNTRNTAYIKNLTTKVNKHCSRKSLETRHIGVKVYNVRNVGVAEACVRLPRSA